MQKGDIKKIEESARALAEGASADVRNAIETIVQEMRKIEIPRQDQPVYSPSYLMLPLGLAAFMIIFLLIAWG